MAARKPTRKKKTAARRTSGTRKASRPKTAASRGSGASGTKESASQVIDTDPVRTPIEPGADCRASTSSSTRVSTPSPSAA